MNNPNSKVLFIISSLGAGGAEKICTTLLNYLCISYQCDLIVISGSTSAYEIDRRVNVIFLNKKKGNIKTLEKILTIIKNVSSINQFIERKEKDGKPYSLITAHLNMAYILSLFLKKRRHIMYIFHNPQSHNNMSVSLPYRTLFRCLFQNKKIGVVSTGIQDELVQKYGIKKNNIRVLWNPVDITLIKEESIKLFSKRRPYILGIGRLTSSKRFDRMIDVYKTGELYRKFDLIICGDGELKDKLENKIKQLGMEKYVFLLGFQRNPYVWMKNAELMLLTSDYEALPMCIIEGLAVGTKIVCADCDYGPRELLVDDLARFLVKPIDSVSQYLTCINNALQLYPKVQSFYVERFSIEKISQRYFEVYRELG